MRPISTCEMFTTRQTKTNECTTLTDETLGQKIQNKKWIQTVRTQSEKKLKRRKGTGVSQRYFYQAEYIKTKPKTS